MIYLLLKPLTVLQRQPRAGNGSDGNAEGGCSHAQFVVVTSARSSWAMRRVARGVPSVAFAGDVMILGDIGTDPRG